MEANRQTASYLMRRFKETGLQPDRRRGQNFLIDLNLLQLLAETAEVGPQDVVLEVGTGLGSLTGLMAPRAAAIVTVEVDARLYSLASEELSRFDNVTMLHQDALKNKNQFHPRVLSTIQQRLDEAPGRQLKLAANLPYNIATPIVSNLLSTPQLPVSMTVTIQKELADRLAAAPNSKDYSALSIWVQSQCDVRIVRVMAPTVFWPRPKVHSAIVQIVPDLDRRASIPDREFFHRFVRAMFFHRRKFLRSVLLSAFKKQLSKPQADAILSEMGFKGDARAEQLSVEQMLALSDLVRQQVESAPKET